jgi:Ketopantoate reductase PanE/ApbA C terminal
LVANSIVFAFSGRCWVLCRVRNSSGSRSGRRCAWLSRRLRWSSRLVATASENRLSIRRSEPRSFGGGMTVEYQPSEWLAIATGPVSTHLAGRPTPSTSKKFLNPQVVCNLRLLGVLNALQGNRLRRCLASRYHCQSFLATARKQLTAKGSPLTSSMYRDLEKGRPIEVEAIIGDLVARGHSAGIKAPLLTAAYGHLSVYQSRIAKVGQQNGPSQLRSSASRCLETAM